MLPGCEGILVGVTDNVCVVLLPQALLADTVMLPAVLLDVGEINVVVDDPVHPVGSVQV